MEQKKELSIILAEDCMFSPDTLPFFENCRDLAFRINRLLGGVSIKFWSGMCQLFLRGRHVASFYFKHSTNSNASMMLKEMGWGSPKQVLWKSVWDEQLLQAFSNIVDEESKRAEELKTKLQLALS